MHNNDQLIHHYHCQDMLKPEGKVHIFKQYSTCVQR